MYKNLALNLYNDVSFDSHNDLVMIADEFEATQALKLLVGTRAGEWFLNPRHGLDYDVFMGEKWDRVQQATRAAFIECLNQEPRIEEILNLDFEFDGTQRQLRVDFSVRMDGRIVGDSLEVAI